MVVVVVGRVWLFGACVWLGIGTGTGAGAGGRGQAGYDSPQGQVGLGQQVWLGDCRPQEQLSRGGRGDVRLCMLCVVCAFSFGGGGG